MMETFVDMAKPTLDDLKQILLELDIIQDKQWREALEKSEVEKKSVWKILMDHHLLTKKQSDTMEMCGKGYIPLNVAKVTVSMDKGKIKKAEPQKPVVKKQDEKPAGMAQVSEPPKPVSKEEISDRAEKLATKQQELRKKEYITKQPSEVDEQSSQPSVRTLDSTSLVEKIKAKSANTPIEDLYKSGEVHKLSAKDLSSENAQVTSAEKTEHSQDRPNITSTKEYADTTRDTKKSKKSDLSHLVGKKLGKFQLSTQLGKGSAGTVFLAHHMALNMPVAIKILDPGLAIAYPELIDRFMHEARSAARINHPNVIRVLDCDCIDDLHLIVMEYVDGISLAELVSMNGALGEDRALKYILAVAEGLEAAVKVGIIHRDIKPANILVTKNKQIRIADMGLARAITEESIIDTSHGVGLGTPQYFPPEQARDASSADQRSDMYALGVTLYVLLAGELPFKGKTLLELIRQHEEEYAIPLNVLNPSITQKTTNLVIKMMQKNPKDRYQSYSELIQAIQECVVDCQTRSDDLGGASSSRQSFSVLNKIGNMFGKKK